MESPFWLVSMAPTPKGVTSCDLRTGASDEPDILDLRVLWFSVLAACLSDHHVLSSTSIRHSASTLRMDIGTGQVTPL